VRNLGGKRGLSLAASVVLLFVQTAAAADVELALSSVAPTRPHFLRPGTETTFVVRLRNGSWASRRYSVAIERGSERPEDWSAGLSLADEHFRPTGPGARSLSLWVRPRQVVHIVARIAASPGLAEGEEGDFQVTASSNGLTSSSLTLAARIRNRPKIYYVALDAAGRNYLRIGRDGNWYDNTNERLMPQSWAFLSDAAFLARATGHLPANTDANHAAALTGSWPGTLGIFSVKTHYLGSDSESKPVHVRASKALLRFGLDGRPIRTVFDVIKDPSQGGSPQTFNALVTGKAWVTDIFSDGDGVVDLLASGLTHPDYVPPPTPFRLGDPASDPDPETDREGTNTSGWAFKTRSLLAQISRLHPGGVPEDRWVASAAMRVIAAEDPDVLYVVLAECDTVQHIFGAADAPEEWNDNDTPDVLWDDVNVHNRSANRDPVLDIVHEADFSFGLIIDFLKSRRAFDGSFVVLLSDHGQTTDMHSQDTQVNLGKILTGNGIDGSAVEHLVSTGQFGWMALADPGRGPEIESLLEGYEVFHPALGRMIKPFVVVDREEMESGIDNVEGYLTQDGILGNLRGELYSAWSIDVPSSDNSKVRWPDLMFFTRHRVQTSLVQTNVLTKPALGTIFNGHHASLGTTSVILSMRGPGIRPGTYDQSASLADIAPTLYRLIGVAMPENVDGIVLEPILVSP
jgi:predicted AlkP superfamily pyrophosphatase or phosphodiesterase